VEERRKGEKEKEKEKKAMVELDKEREKLMKGRKGKDGKRAKQRACPSTAFRGVQMDR